MATPQIQQFQLDPSINLGGGTSINDTFLEVPSGAIDGVNTSYTVSQALYAAGKLQVFRNGILQITGTDITETDPATGVFAFTTAPLATDDIRVVYNTSTTTSEDLVARVNNENLFKFTNEVNDEVPSGDDIEISSGTDVGKKTIMYADGSETITKTLDGSHAEGESLVFALKTDTAQIEVVPSTSSISLIMQGETGTNNSLRLDTVGQMVTIMKTDVANEYIASGSFTAFETTLLGPELIVNQTFDDDSWWTYLPALPSAQHNVGSGTYNMTSDGTLVAINSPNILTAGNNYRLTYTVTANTAGGLRTDSFAVGSNQDIPDSVGTHSVDFQADNQQISIKRAFSTTTLSLDNISIQEIL